MDKTTMNALVVSGSAVAGGVLGRWAGAKLGATYGMRAGPWGVVAGALLGALAGNAINAAMRGPELPANIDIDPGVS
jgi:uncharacterized protein YcfJ